MTPYKQGVAYWAFSKLSIADYQRVFEMGITGVEMAPREKYDELREVGFTLSTIGGHKSLEDGLNKRENHSRIADELRASLEIAKQYQIPNLIVFSGNRNGKSEQEGAENTIEGLNLVKADAEAAGVTLILELLNSKVNHPDYQCDHTAWGVQVVSAVNSPQVKLLYDIYHMQIMEGDLIRTIRENIAHIGHFHTAGNPGRNDLDENQEIFYPPIARAIAELGYDRWIGHEFSPKKDPFESLREAYAAMDV
ncbi:MAG TPA: TIM barrel protein [Abditibacterium sp.]